jgi:DNA-binding NarL/FixJ family response regulator
MSRSEGDSYMDKQDLSRIEEKLDKIIKLLILSSTPDWTQKDQIALLHRLGFAPKEIAEILGTTANTVSVTLSNLRSPGKLKGKKGAKGDNDQS